MSFTEWPIIKRGDDWKKTITLAPAEGAPAVNISGSKLWLTIKRRITDTYAQAAVRLTTEPGEGLVILDGTRFTAAIPRATSRLLKAGPHFIDVQARTPAGEWVTMQLPETIQASDDVSDPPDE